MKYEKGDIVTHTKSGLKGKVIATEDKDPQGRIIVECTVSKNGNVGFQVLTELPSEFHLV